MRPPPTSRLWPLGLGKFEPSEQIGHNFPQTLPRPGALPEIAMGGAVLGEANGGLGAEPPALKNFAFFCKNNFILRLF